MVSYIYKLFFGTAAEICESCDLMYLRTRRQVKRKESTEIS